MHTQNVVTAKEQEIQPASREKKFHFDIFNL